MIIKLICIGLNIVLNLFVIGRKCVSVKLWMLYINHNYPRLSSDIKLLLFTWNNDNKNWDKFNYICSKKYNINYNYIIQHKSIAKYFKLKQQ
jgi:hypothetical protein